MLSHPARLLALHKLLSYFFLQFSLGHHLACVNSHPLLDENAPLPLQLVHRKLRVSDANYGGSSGFVTFGTPGLALLHGQTPTYRQLRLAIVKAIRRFVHPPPGQFLFRVLEI